LRAAQNKKEVRKTLKKDGFFSLAGGLPSETMDKKPRHAKQKRKSPHPK